MLVTGRADVERCARREGLGADEDPLRLLRRRCSASSARFVSSSALCWAASADGASAGTSGASSCAHATGVLTNISKKSMRFDNCRFLTGFSTSLTC